MAKEKKYGDKTLCVIDNGLFCELAVRLSQDFGRVLYFNNFKSAFAGINEGFIGKGLDGIEKINNLFDVVDETDIFLFPDVYDGDMQEYLRNQDKLVFGSGKADNIELYRKEFKALLKKLKLDVIPTEYVKGMTALRERLQKVKDKYIKVSYWRDICETFYHKNYDLTKPILDEIQYRISGAAEEIEFLIEDKVPGSEIGYDGYCIDGKYPSIATQGYEVKGMAYGCVVLPYEKLTDSIKDVNAKMASVLKSHGLRGFLSTEIRVAKNGKYYYTDPCIRSGSPPNETYQELFLNLADIIWQGAQGKLIDPVTENKYGAELILHSNRAMENWVPLKIPDEIKQWVKLRNCCKIDDIYYIMPQSSKSTNCGAIVGLSNESLDDCYKKIKEIGEQIEAPDIDFNYEYLDKINDYVEEGKKLGINFE